MQADNLIAADIDDEVDDSTETSTIEFDIVVTASDWTLELLAKRFKERDIVIPSYQRKFVWDIRKSSKLIESFAIGLPVPQVFFYENPSGELEVIDGQQRITSIYYFFEGYFGQDDRQGRRKRFRLTGLEQRKDLEGKIFDDVDGRTKRRLKNSSLRGVTVKQLAPDSEHPESVYHIFERLNTGGQPLNAQEIRNVVYRGRILEKLEELNKIDSWRMIYGKDKADATQRDIELILRLFSLFESIQDYKPPMKDFLSRQMHQHRSFESEKADRFCREFRRVSDAIATSLKSPFRPKGLLNAATMEAVMVTLMERGAGTSIGEDGYKRLLADDGFRESIFSNTTSTENVNRRKTRAQEILLAQ
ncbi:MAG: DUF262 domain-containing protein [Rhodobacteraceae bacterium]|nr:DUF262 domain-containing protein [Paracoccaceae bacterium]